MTSYRIGRPATSIIGFSIHIDGTIAPIARYRADDGALVDAPEQSWRAARHVIAATCIVLVNKNHGGVVEVAPGRQEYPFARMVFPLGSEKPFLESELPPSPGANGAFSVTEDITFHFNNGILRWGAQNMGGRLALSTECPEIHVLLRLPEGNRGSVIFAAPIFSRRDGTLENVIAAA